MSTTTFTFKRRCIIWIGHILKTLGVKDTDLLLYGLKKRNIKYIIGGIRGSKYFFIDENIYEHALKFASYIHNPHKENFIQNLLQGTDTLSQTTVHQKIAYIQEILEHKTDIITKQESTKNSIKFINKYIKQTKIKLPLHYYDDSVLYYKHGINEIAHSKTYTHNKDIIDCGAFIGDSALMFAYELPINKIYCLEPETENFDLLQKVIHDNHKQNQIIPIKIGLGDKAETIYIRKMGAGSFVDQSGDYAIQIDSIDNIVQKYSIIPGLIKRDIEGWEYKSILGAKKTISTYKPILLISIYHNGKDFFEIKPLIESWNLGYKFKIRHLKANHPFADTTLIAYI